MKTRKQIEQEKAEQKKNFGAKVIFWAILATPVIGFIYGAICFVSALAGMLAAVPK